MTSLAREVFAALTTGLVLSAVISATSELYPEFDWMALILFIGGLIVAGYDLYDWIVSSSVENVYFFVVGAISATFGLATALASTEVLIYMFIVAVLVDAVIGAVAKLHI